jgi:PH-interacting protein
MIRIRSKKILKDSLDNQGNGGCDLSTDKSANMTQYPVKEMLEHDGSSGNTPEYKGDGLEESDTRIGEISMPSLDDSVGSRSHPKKMFDVVYRRSKPGRGKINSERDGSIREETSIACNPHLDSRGDSYEGTIGGSHRLHSMGSKGTHDANIAINDLHLGQGHESDDTCRDTHNGSVSRFQLPCEEWGSSSRMTVRLRSTRNRKASCHFHDTSPVDGKRKLHQSAKRASWLMLSMHEEGSRYIPQQGDELAYLRQVTWKRR